MPSLLRGCAGCRRGEGASITPAARAAARWSSWRSRRLSASTRWRSRSSSGTSRWTTGPLRRPAGAGRCADAGGRRPRGAKETFRLAAELAQRVGSPDQLGRASLGYGGRFAWSRAAGDGFVVSSLEEALAAVDPESTCGPACSRACRARSATPRPATRRLLESAGGGDGEAARRSGDARLRARRATRRDLGPRQRGRARRAHRRDHAACRGGRRR